MEAIMEYECEKVRSEVFPFFKEFSDRGIVPKILSVDKSSPVYSIRREHVIGVPLAAVLCYLVYRDESLENLKQIFNEEWMSKNSGEDALVEIYRKLGSMVGYTTRRKIAHNDLHTENVVVNVNGRPYIIDWEKSSVTKRKRNLDTCYLIGDTNTSLKGIEQRDMISKLEGAYSANFGKL